MEVKVCCVGRALTFNLDHQVHDGSQWKGDLRPGESQLQRCHLLDVPVTAGGDDRRDEATVKCGVGTVSKTPALVPTHNRSRHTNMDVTRKQAALCCLMMSSQPANKVQGASQVSCL